MPYMIRTCLRAEDGTLESPSPQAKGFTWPSEPGSLVEAPDWDPEGRCGGGLHGLMPGQQDPGMWAEVWMIASYEEGSEVDLDGKIKVPRCVVEALFEGPVAAVQATAWLRERGVKEPLYRGHDIAGFEGTATAGDGGEATAGDEGTATAGNRGKATAGYGGEATAGDYGTATVGNRGTATAGYNGKATAGHYGKATAGDYGTATAGYDGKATAGNRGEATAGFNGKATAGGFGTATAGIRGKATAGAEGTATAGKWGTLQIAYHDGKRTRQAIAYVGERAQGLPEGQVIQPDTPYQVDRNGNWVTP